MKIIPLDPTFFDQLKSLYDSYDRPNDDWPPKNKCIEILNSIRNQNGEIYIAVIDKKLVGTYAIYVCHNLTRGARPFGVIENVICSVEYRRQGIGKKLMIHAKETAYDKGCYKLFLQTGAQRLENHSFYSSCGFLPNKTGFEVRFDI